MVLRQDKNSPTVPKITEKAVEDMYNNPRMTNEEIFAFILSDLDKAEEYIAGYKRADKYTPDLSVVYGLKARAYLTMADWANAEKYAKLAQQGYTEMTGEEYTSKTTGFNTANSSWMFATHFKSDDPNLRDNDGDTSWASQMIIEIGGSKGDCGYAANYGYPLVVDRHLYETIPATDFRKNCFVDFNIDNLKTNAEKLEALAKYSNEPSYILKAGAAATTYGGNVGGLSVKFRPVNGACDQPLAIAGAVDVPLMRVEEMKLIEIEAAGMQNESKGIEMLTEFAKKRDPQYEYGKHNVEDDLDTFSMSGIDEFLKHHVAGALAVAALVAAVDLREVGGMVAVVVIPRGILHDGVDPDSGEAKGFDIVEPVDESLEVTTPAWVFGRLLAFLIVPAEHIVAWITVIKTGSKDEVDALVAEVCSAAYKAVRHHALTEEQSGERQCGDPSCKVFHVWVFNNYSVIDSQKSIVMVF